MAEGSAALDYPLATPPDPGRVLELAPGVNWLRMPLPFPPGHINLWLLADGEGWTIVDCGLARDEVKALWEQVFASSLAGRPVTRLVVTHFHPDHLGLSAWLLARWGIEAWMTAAEWTQARAVHGSGSAADIDTRLAFVRANGVGPERIGAFTGPPNEFYRRGVPEVPAAFRRLRGGEAVPIDARAWVPIIGRGHAPEHACLWCEALGVLICGDILLPRISPNVSVWASEPFADPLRDFLDSLDGFAPLPADTLVLPAHGLPYRGVHARIAALKAHHGETLERLLDSLDRPRHAEELLPVMFRREIGPHNIVLALGETIAHLHRLEAEGRARREQDNGVWRFRRA
ncbi:MAG: MBL fold metallo-hydrolase [Pseudomonadota bacterium]